MTFGIYFLIYDKTVILNHDNKFQRDESVRKHARIKFSNIVDKSNITYLLIFKM